jgi:hypothetical protein
MNLPVNPIYINISFIFEKILKFFEIAWSYISKPKFWNSLGDIVSIIIILCLFIIIYSLVRMYEIRKDQKEEVKKKIQEMIEKESSKEENGNYRWHYILTLIEGVQESDWRVAILEADSLMEEVLKEKGFSGETLNELLTSARESGFSHIQDAWDAHIFRNSIAHNGINVEMTQSKGRQIIKKYQNFFEELGVI